MLEEQRAVDHSNVSARYGAARERVGSDSNGAPNTNRTCDLPLRRGLLYPLSYRGVPVEFYRIDRIGPAGRAGLREPPSIMPRHSLQTLHEHSR